MREDINMDDLIISSPYGDENSYESVSTFWDMDPYIKWLKINFALEVEEGGKTVHVYDEEENALPFGCLSGALILGRQASDDGHDINMLCDDCDGDLVATITELEREGVIEKNTAYCPDILYIHNLELSSELLEARNIRQFFEMIPDMVFQYTNVKPEITTYLIAGIEGFYEEQACSTSYDPRSVDGFSPLIFSENGYTLGKSGNLLYDTRGYKFI